MDLGPFWEAASRSVTQEFRNIYWSQKVPYHVPIRRQMNLVQATRPIFLSYVFILSSHLHLSLPLVTFQSKSYVHASSPIRATCTSHLILLDMITLLILCIPQSTSYKYHHHAVFFQPPLISSLFGPDTVRPH
jgi:hypothetical protein